MSGEFQEVLKEKDLSQTVAILDAGAQYGGLIDRVVWEGGVATDHLPLETPADELVGYGAIIISGGPDSVYEEGAPDCDPAVFDAGVPVLGICYGMQLMAKHCGGQIERSAQRQDGVMMAWTMASSALFEGTGTSQKVLMTHGDSVVAQPEGFGVISSCDDVIAAMEYPGKSLYATQFHPEVSDTENGEEMIRNFVTGIAGIEPYLDVADLRREAVDYIQEYVGDREVMLFLSGGVDSTVLAALMAEAIDPSKINAYHVDTGFMRLHESNAVLESLASLGIEVTVIDAGDEFQHATTTGPDGLPLPPLSEAIEPQHKRHIIGDEFIAVRERMIQAAQSGHHVVLAQGSIRPDLIESGSILASATGKADTIKTHHNDAPAVRALRELGLVCEPLQRFYKDQVRELGRQLGLPEEVVNRQPFPGPGLAIRVLCSSGEQPQTRQETDIVDRQILESTLPLHGKGIQNLRVLPVKTVGVQGDSRSYKHLLGIDISYPMGDWSALIDVARRAPQEVEVNRAAAIIRRNPHLFGEAHLIRAHLTPENVELLRGADAIVNDVLRKYGLDKTLSQVPVILVPVSFYDAGHFSVALRPFITRDFMTGRAALPGKDIPLGAVDEMVQGIFKYSKEIDAVLYDLSSKPPGTTEWE